MLPLPLIPMAVRNLPWRAISLAVAVISLISLGVWFRGVLADRAELSSQNQSQAQELANLSGEIERMNNQQAADHALFENIEAQKKILAADLHKQSAALRNLRKELNDAANNCFDLVLPPAYLDGLPKAAP